MTEAKSLNEKEALEGLLLDEESQMFLTSPYREKYMTLFLLGSNRFGIYGQFFTMATRSTFFMEIMDILGKASPPHAIFGSDVILERPITLLWLYMNGYDDPFINNLSILSLAELLHMQRLFDYFIIKDDDYYTKIMNSILTKIYYTDAEIIRATIKTRVDKDSLISMLNRFIKNADQNSDWKSLLSEKQREDIMKSSTDKKKTLADIERIGVMQLFTKMTKVPEILKEIDYIIVLCRDIGVNYAERKALMNPDSLGRLNPDWKKVWNGFKKLVDGFWATLIPKTWGPDFIRFDVQWEGIPTKTTWLEIAMFHLNPILAS